MKKTPMAVVPVLAGVVLAAAAPLAARTFGPNDTGVIPPDAPKGPFTKCELKSQ
jgi:hypothetical protein